MEELLYSVNIILNLLGSADWMADFITSKGHNVTEELLLSLISSSERNARKISVKLCRILTKIMENNSSTE